MNTEKRELLMNSFFNAQFDYCPLIWMLHSRYNDNRIKHLHDRRLRLSYCDKFDKISPITVRKGWVSLYPP